MNKFGRRIIASCLMSCMVINSAPIDVSAKVNVNFTDDFDGDDEPQYPWGNEDVSVQKRQLHRLVCQQMHLRVYLSQWQHRQLRSQW